jgi:hypothetical protein
LFEKAEQEFGNLSRYINTVTERSAVLWGTSSDNFSSVLCSCGWQPQMLKVLPSLQLLFAVVITLLFVYQTFGLVCVRGTTTGEDIFCEIYNLFKGCGLILNKLVCIVTWESRQSMVGVLWEAERKIR